MHIIRLGEATLDAIALQHKEIASTSSEASASLRCVNKVDRWRLVQAYKMQTRLMQRKPSCGTEQVGQPS